MTRIAQKVEELSNLKEFLRNQLRLDLTEIKPALKEPPDGSATIKNPDGTTLLLDFEIVEYYVDASRNEEGGSPRKRARGYWDRVTAALDAQLGVLRRPVHLSVRFKEPTKLKNTYVDPIARELIRFAQEFCPEGHGCRTDHDVFSAASYPLLNEHVEQVWLTRFNGTLVSGWHCSNLAAAHVGPVMSLLSGPHSEEEWQDLHLDAWCREVPSDLRLRRNGHEPRGATAS